MLRLLFLPFRLLYALCETAWGLFFGIVGGLFALVFGLIEGLLPLILVGGAIALIAAAARGPKPIREQFTSYYTQGKVE